MGISTRIHVTTWDLNTVLCVTNQDTPNMENCMSIMMSHMISKENTFHI